jgi:soluble lytic murein transglycosylase-like protein
MTRTWLEWWDGTPGIQQAPTVTADNPEASIQRRCDYMVWLLARHGGDLEQATAAYNWGTGNVTAAVKRWGPLWVTMAPKETRDYLRRITERVAVFRAAEADVRGRV